MDPRRLNLFLHCEQISYRDNYVLMVFHSHLFVVIVSLWVHFGQMMRHTQFFEGLKTSLRLMVLGNLSEGQQVIT